MSFDSPDPPAAPDPATTAKAQGAANKETAIAQAQLNMINQETPFGGLTYEQRGSSAEGIPQYVAKQTLAAPQQAIADEAQTAALKFGQTGNQLLNSTAQMLGTPFSLNQFGAMPQANEARRVSSRDALLQRLQPKFDQDLAALETKLANQGIGIGSKAYNQEMDRYSRALNDARLSADIQGTNVMAQELGLEQTQRNAAIAEALMPRQTALNELAALTRGAQITPPTFVSTPQTAIAGTDVLGAYGQANAVNANNYNQAMGQQNAMMGGLFQLGGSALQGGFFGGGKGGR
jgi:hypothetical protein